MTEPVVPALTPSLTVADAAAEIDFLVRAFGAVEMVRVPDASGKLIHAAVRINDTVVMLNDDFPEMSGGRSMTPTALGGSPVTLHLTVADIDARFQQAVDAGAEVISPPRDEFWGDRYGVLCDPAGMLWSMGQPIEEVGLDDIKKAAGSTG